MRNEKLKLWIGIITLTITFCSLLATTYIGIQNWKLQKMVSEQNIEFTRLRFNLDSKNSKCQNIISIVQLLGVDFFNKEKLLEWLSKECGSDIADLQFLRVMEASVQGQEFRHKIQEKITTLEKKIDANFLTITPGRFGSSDYDTLATRSIYLNVKYPKKLTRIEIRWGDNSTQVLSENLDSYLLDPYRTDWYFYSIQHTFNSYYQKEMSVIISTIDQSSIQNTKKIFIK